MATNDQVVKNTKFRDAFLANEQQVRISTGKWACALVFILMPCGVSLDYFVLEKKYLLNFFELRLLCSMLVGIVWLLHSTSIARQHYPVVGLPIVILPTFFICWMIYKTNGANSHYYAGLNLIMLAVSAVGHWSIKESVLAVGSVLLLYLTACAGHGLKGENFADFFNNIYFLILTGIIVICGNHLFNRLRLSEFRLRYELAENKEALQQSNRNFEASNLKLAEQNSALEKANRETQEAQAKLAQSEKMALLGRFSASLMHDILNPLNYVKTGLYTLNKKSRSLAPELRTHFDTILTDIKDGVDRVQERVQSLRNYSHPGARAAEAVDLTAILNDVRNLVAGDMKDKNISLQLNIWPKQMVWVGRNDFSIIFINLLENSIDALEGKLFAPEEKPMICVTSRSEGERTLISIHDNGSGIDPKIIGTIFEPFSTTKVVGKGTGLGLSICSETIRGYGGTISVNSELGKFSEFILDLPASAEAAAQTKLSHAEPIRL